MMRLSARLLSATLTFLLVAAGSASAQVDLSGTWQDEPYTDALGYTPGPGIVNVDFTGMPISEAGRVRGLTLSYDTQIGSIDRACELYTTSYGMQGPQGIRIWPESDPVMGDVIAWHITWSRELGPIKVWMDGRPHPSPLAAHTNSGFATGRWEDDVLVVDISHLKVGVLRRNGVPHSDETTMRLRYFRNGDLLTVSGRFDDPNYLAEPMYLLKTYRLMSMLPLPIGSVASNFLPGSTNPPANPCPGQSEGVPAGTVRHYLPGQNPFVDEITKSYGIPVEAVLGGPHTMYPEYRQTLKGKYVRPEKCPVRDRGCGGPGTYNRQLRD
jgi:hypothetical protein